MVGYGVCCRPVLLLGFGMYGGKIVMECIDNVGGFSIQGFLKIGLNPICDEHYYKVQTSENQFSLKFRG